MFKSFKFFRLASAAALLALLVSFAPAVAAQEQTATQSPTQQQPTTPAKSETPVPEPLYKEYRGVTLGMSASDVRARLGKPQEKSDEMDFFVFSERERARVYYTDGKATAVIATYIGKDGGAPPPVKVLGAEVEAKADGSMYMMTPYKQAGYWVAYSRTPGEQPMVMITMQKSP